MSTGRKSLLTNEEAATRSLANLRVAASTSFSEAEVDGLRSLFTALRRGAHGSAITISRAGPLVNVQKKLESMHLAILRQHERRALREQIVHRDVKPENESTLLELLAPGGTLVIEEEAPAGEEAGG